MPLFKGFSKDAIGKSMGKKSSGKSPVSAAVSKNKTKKMKPTGKGKHPANCKCRGCSDSDYA